MHGGQSWQTAIRTAVRDPVELCRLLDLPASVAEAAVKAAGDFPVFAPREYIARMCRGDAADPLLRQVLPVAAEQHNIPGFSDDPVGDLASQQRPGMLHKYAGRVLLIVTGACAVHCRYCFRRHFPYTETPRGLAAWQSAIADLAADPSIEEVILSGGDPLTLVDDQLAALVEQLAQIRHLRRLRVHTRLPIVIPQRVTSQLVAWLSDSRLTPVVVVHANHPAEIDGDVAAAIGRLRAAGCMVLNQSVLLRGVNDDAAVLADLSRRLIDIGVLPYYLHQLDRVRGAAHFEVPVERGLDIMSQMRATLPGYAVPRFVVEQPGAPNKTILA